MHNLPSISATPERKVQPAGMWKIRLFRHGMCAGEESGFSYGIVHACHDKDPQGLLLIDEWADQEALNRYHSSPMMTEAAALREKYGLTGRKVTMFNPLGAATWPKGEPNDAYAQYFTGQSYLNPLPGGYANVTFEPGCRNNWHVHHGAVQVLICVTGRGWYQEWGKPAVPLTPGTVIEVPEGVKHWHGAAANSWMQHLALHKDVQEGASNEWLEPVSDEQYKSVE